MGSRRLAAHVFPGQRHLSVRQTATRAQQERVFAAEEPPVLLDSDKHAVGYLSSILNARVYDVAYETPLQHARSLSKALENNILLKREDMQPVHSFKIRGAYNKMVQLPQSQLDLGVVACSAGNHAQGVALSAAQLGCRAVIVMPLATPRIKVDAVRAFGGLTTEVVLHGNNYDEAAAEAQRFQKEQGLEMIHPFDDPAVIAGQGTVGAEILKQTTSRELDAIFVCCGGGGMLAGVAAYVKRVRPLVKVIGVEAEDAAGMTASLAAGQVVTLPSVGLFADGAAVRTVGQETFRVCSQLVDGMVTVTTDELCAAIKNGFEDTRCVFEPAGALGIAGAKKYLQDNHMLGSTVVAVTSGANIDFDRLRFVSERADSTETLLSVRIPERPGAFRDLYSVIAPRNVTEFSYRYNTAKRADVIISFQAKGNGAEKLRDKQQVIQELEDCGYGVSNLDNDELGKVHLRHLAGGRPPPGAVLNEQLYRFQFPEAPGALSRFLNSLNKGWDVSLFHYRSHGDDFGRVLVGILVSPTEEEQFNSFLQELGYEYHREGDNPLYDQFLR
uniref:Threonine dehydratase n=2 Tax=Rhizochromulina marina TaxID=1034831 RepID=A0A7S2SP50_9STRA|mmetsp:Transcript_3440/g.10023  ORF Transcript_3440/g.10023 Transcript_3440/m.10023 type:complete len:557 (+) Transcript_3440:43-1713(+)